MRRPRIATRPSRRPPLEIPRLPSRSTLAICLWLFVLAAGCAPKRVTLPADPGTPLADFAGIHDAVSKECRAVRTLTAALGLSGSAGDLSLRGTVEAGFRRPDSMRLTMRVSFSTIFVLVANDRGATLLYNRERRVVRGARADELLGALIGIKLTPADLQAIATGCVVPEPRATGGRLHGSSWASIDLEGGATLYLQRARDVWRLRAARRGDWLIEYPQLLPLFQKLGLEYCCGGKSLRTACNEQFLNPHDVSAQIALAVTPNKSTGAICDDDLNAKVVAATHGLIA